MTAKKMVGGRLLSVGLLVCLTALGCSSGTEVRQGHNYGSKIAQAGR